MPGGALRAAAALVQCPDERLVELQQRLPTGAHHEPLAGNGPGPGGPHPLRQIIGGGELPASRPVRADEIGVAEPADRVRPVGLAPAPEIASREPEEYGGPARVEPLPLEGRVDLLHEIGHVPAGVAR